MEEWFEVDGLDTERLLAEWRWLCPNRLRMVARNVFGELFLQHESGAIFRLNTTTGKFSKVSESESEFQTLAKREKCSEWFAESESLAYERLGLTPNSSQCIGFPVPAVFAEGGRPDTAYVADLYEYVSFLGDLHRQIASVPDGSKVELKIQAPNPAP